MIATKTVHPNLVRAYREAIYIVNEGDDAIALKVGEVSPALAALMHVHKATTAAILTAYNPYSEIQPSAENERMQAALVAELKATAVVCFDAIGSDPNGDWEPEASTLALGISLVEAERLADQFSQNAFLWISNASAFINLKLRYPVGDPTPDELTQWFAQLDDELRAPAIALSAQERNWLMTTSRSEQRHWLLPSAWDWNTPWPLARPDGCAISIGTELDRMFKLVSSGLEKLHP
jgi:hypothetical protein